MIIQKIVNLNLIDLQSQSQLPSSQLQISITHKKKGRTFKEKIERKKLQISVSITQENLQIVKVFEVHHRRGPPS